MPRKNALCTEYNTNHSHHNKQVKNRDTCLAADAKIIAEMDLEM